jgi:predicted DNA-binding protein
MCEEMVRTTLYINQRLKERVADLADRERRSWSQMATLLIEEHLQEIEQTAPLSSDTRIGVAQ